MVTRMVFLLVDGSLKEGQRENAEGRDPSARPARRASPLFFNLPILPLKWSQSPVPPQTGCAYETRPGTGPTAKSAGQLIRETPISDGPL